VPRAAPPAPDTLVDLVRLIRRAEGFPPVVAALREGHGGTIDGAWGSSAALAVAGLLREASQTVLVVLAHARDVDGWVGDLLGFTGNSPAIFTASDIRPGSDEGFDESTTQRFRLLRQLEGTAAARLVLTTFAALMQPVPDRAALAATKRLLKIGEELNPEEIAGWLVAHGYRPADAVELPGEFSRRGGILDLFSPDAEAPHRLEFFGDEVESIRQFSPQTQRSLGTVEALEISGAGAVDQSARQTGHFADYLPKSAWIVLQEADELQDQGKQYLERMPSGANLFDPAAVFARLLRFPTIKVSALPSPTMETACHLRVESVERFSGDVNRVRDELDGVAINDHVLIACPSEGEIKRLTEILTGGKLARAKRLRLTPGQLRAGFRLLGERGGVVVLGSQELFQREEARPIAPKRRRLESRAIDSFLDLTEDDLVVHVSHGIARFRGMQMLEKGAAGPQPVVKAARQARHTEEHLVLEFRDAVRVYVPATKIDLVQKYVGGSGNEPELSKFGGTGWHNRKQRVEAAVMDLASDMIQLQALRAAQPGTALPPDSEWQGEFEAAFPYEETPDQLTTLSEIKADLERARPMDRLVCGDVGYGKTELALRAAFKAIDNGRQVAVLVPTTVLAEQHFRTFSQRLAEYPFVVECLSRFRTSGDQRRIVERLGKGGVDVIVGTHRLVSADVQFKDLGLVVIDEEQRFGVEHKERLKRLRQQVDVLTLTATPIPRTLHLSLLGIRDISNLETPPPDRLAIETRIARFDRQLIRNAILRELNREGQVYFVHNRVYDIQTVANRLVDMVPEARFTIAHGQMAEGELEQAMVRFVRREADVLVATTIIESGLDIPNANTIFIDQADHYGLADLHQLRGRVGRYKHRAYAYLLLDGDRPVTSSATKRLKAIEEFTELGAGFKIALRDLEIRGAGNILGTQQSGHIAAVGYELYCQLLEDSVRRLKQQPPRTVLEVTVDLPWAAFLPRDYVPGQRLRIEVYRRLARVRSLERLDDFRQELRDRFGAIPESAERLLWLAELRLLATAWRIATVHLETPPEGISEPTYAVLGYRGDRKIKELAERARGRVRIVDEASAYVPLRPNELEPESLYQSLRHLLRL
jgi:transcription-repair coupling factor (superfamily II helicase)